jgi:predicted nucleic acid-binding protein
VSLYSFDTQVLTWAMKGIYDRKFPIREKPKNAPPPDPEHEEMKATAVDLCEALELGGKRIALTSIVVGEILCAVAPESHVAAMNILAVRFQVMPFDAPTAMVFGELYQVRYGDGTVEALQKLVPPPTRAALKADLMIVATAIRWNLAGIYSHDPALKKLAHGRLPVMEMPPRQPKQSGFDFPKP